MFLHCVVETDQKVPYDVQQVLCFGFQSKYRFAHKHSTRAFLAHTHKPCFSHTHTHMYRLSWLVCNSSCNAVLQSILKLNFIAYILGKLIIYVKQHNTKVWLQLIQDPIKRPLLHACVGVFVHVLQWDRPCCRSCDRAADTVCSVDVGIKLILCRFVSVV